MGTIPMPGSFKIGGIILVLDLKAKGPELALGEGWVGGMGTSFGHSAGA